MRKPDISTVDTILDYQSPRTWNDYIQSMQIRVIYSSKISKCFFFLIKFGFYICTSYVFSFLTCLKVSERERVGAFDVIPNTWNHREKNRKKHGHSAMFKRIKVLIRKKSDIGISHFLIDEFSPMSLMTFPVHFFDEGREACFSLPKRNLPSWYRDREIFARM